MKKVIFTFIISVLFLGAARSQIIADFQDPSAYSVRGVGFTVQPVIGNDPADATNKVLVFQKEVDPTFDQEAHVVLKTPVSITKGATKLSFKIKGPVTGARPYIRAWSGGVEKVNKWAGGTVENANAWNEIVTTDIFMDSMDSIAFFIGGWDNGNAPAGLQGTYYIDDVRFIAPPTGPNIVADFQDADAYIIHSIGFTVQPVIGNDPADATNKVLVFQKEVDPTFDQEAHVVLKTPVSITKGATKLSFKIKGPVTGARPHIRAWSGGVEKANKWAGGTVETANAWNEIVTTDVIMDGLDSISFWIGGWDNGNAPAGLQGTYYIDDVQFLAPPAIPIVKPRKVVNIYKTIDPIELDGFDIEDSWSSASTNDVLNGDSTTVFASNFMAAYDDDYLYLFLAVTDPNPSVYDGVDNWKKDGAQIYWDVRNKLLLNSRSEIRQHQMTIPYGGAQSAMQVYVGQDITSYYANIENPVFFDYYSQSTSKGYNIEMRIPFAPMYFNADDVATFEQCVAAKTIGVNDTLGFELQANNYNIATDNREQSMTWSSTSGDNPGGWQNSGSWGGLRLAGWPTGIAKNAFNTSGMKLYPNPVRNILNVSLKNLKAIEVYNVTGQLLLSSKTSGDSHTLNVESLKSGIYILKAIDGSGITLSNKFQKY